MIRAVVKDFVRGERAAHDWSVGRCFRDGLDAAAARWDTRWRSGGVIGMQGALKIAELEGAGGRSIECSVGTVFVLNAARILNRWLLVRDGAPGEMGVAMDENCC